MLRSCLLCPAARTRSDAASAAAVGRRDTGDWCMRIDLPIPAIVIRAVLDLHTRRKTDQGLDEHPYVGSVVPRPRSPS